MESELLPSNEEDFYDDLKSFFAKCDPYINKDIIGILQELLENAKNFKKHCDEYSFSTYHDNFERYELNYLIPFFNDFTKKNLTKKDDFSSKTLIDYDQSIFSPEDFDYNKILYLLYIIRMCQEIISTKRQELINLYNAYHNTNVMNFIDEKFKPYNHFFNYITSFILSKLDLRVFIDTKISFKIKVYEEIGSSSYDPEKTLEKTVKGNFFDIFLFSNQIPITLSEKTNPVKFIENNFYYVVELLKFQPELINIFPFYKFFDDSYEQKEDIVDSIFYVDYNNFCGILTENLDPDSFLKQIEDHFNDVNDTDKEGYYKNVLTFLKNLIEKRHEEMSQERLEKFISAFNQIKEKLTKHKESKKSALSSSIILDEDSEQSSSYTSHTSSEDNDEIILGTDVNSGKNLEDIQKKEEEAFYEIYNNVNKSNEKIYTSEYYTSEYEKKEYHMQHNDEEPESSVPITVKPEKSNEEESSDEDKKSSDKKSNDENKEEDKNENYNPIYEFYIKNIEKNSESNEDEKNDEEEEEEEEEEEKDKNDKEEEEQNNKDDKDDKDIINILLLNHNQNKDIRDNIKSIKNKQLLVKYIIDSFFYREKDLDKFVISLIEKIFLLPGCKDLIMELCKLDKLYLLKNYPYDDGISILDFIFYLDKEYIADFENSDDSWIIRNTLHSFFDPYEDNEDKILRAIFLFAHNNQNSKLNFPKQFVEEYINEHPDVFLKTIKPFNVPLIEQLFNDNCIDFVRNYFFDALTNEELQSKSKKDLTNFLTKTPEGNNILLSICINYDVEQIGLLFRNYDISKNMPESFVKFLVYRCMAEKRNGTVLFLVKNNFIKLTTLSTTQLMFLYNDLCQKFIYTGNCIDKNIKVCELLDFLKKEIFNRQKYDRTNEQGLDNSLQTEVEIFTSLKQLKPLEDSPTSFLKEQCTFESIMFNKPLIINTISRSTTSLNELKACVESFMPHFRKPDSEPEITVRTISPIEEQKTLQKFDNVIVIGSMEDLIKTKMVLTQYFNKKTEDFINIFQERCKEKKNEQQTKTTPLTTVSTKTPAMTHTTIFAATPANMVNIPAESNIHEQQIQQPQEDKLLSFVRDNFQQSVKQKQEKKQQEEEAASFKENLYRFKKMIERFYSDRDRNINIVEQAIKNQQESEDERDKKSYQELIECKLAEIDNINVLISIYENFYNHINNLLSTGDENDCKKAEEIFKTFLSYFIKLSLNYIETIKSGENKIFEIAVLYSQKSEDDEKTLHEMTKASGEVGEIIEKTERKKEKSTLLFPGD